MTTPTPAPGSSSRPTRSMRENPDLDQIKRQAKELLKAFRAGDRAAVDEVNTHYRDADASKFALHDAQLVIARAYGFESWPKLVKRIDPKYRSKPSQRITQPTSMATPSYQYGVERINGNDAWALMCACADGDLPTTKKLGTSPSST